MKPSWRKPAGIIGLLVYLTLYALIVSSFGDVLARLPTLLTVLGYLVLGLAWVIPLRPLFIWMNTGRWSAPADPKSDK